MSVRDADLVDIGPAATMLSQAGFRGWSRDALSALMRQPTGAVVVDGRSGVPKGVAVGSAVADEAEIHAVVVASSERRRGAGRRLVRALVQRLAAAGAEAVHLEVRADNASALHLYETEGFVRQGRRPRFYGDVDAVLMSLPVLSVERRLPAPDEM